MTRSLAVELAYRNPNIRVNCIQPGPVLLGGDVDNATRQAIADSVLLKSLIENHARYTGSRRAMDILGNWPKWSRMFVKVMPTEYRRALKELAEKSAPVLKQKAA